MRSHGKTKKSPVMTARTSGWRRISAVPEVGSKLCGARMSAFGRGSDVRCGFWDRAASIGLDDEGAVMRCISLHRQTRFPGL